MSRLSCAALLAGMSTGFGFLMYCTAVELSRIGYHKDHRCLLAGALGFLALRIFLGRWSIWRLLHLIDHEAGHLCGGLLCGGTPVALHIDDHGGECIMLIPPSLSPIYRYSPYVISIGYGAAGAGLWLSRHVVEHSAAFQVFCGLAMTAAFARTTSDTFSGIRSDGESDFGDQSRFAKAIPAVLILTANFMVVACFFAASAHRSPLNFVLLVFERLNQGRISIGSSTFSFANSAWPSTAGMMYVAFFADIHGRIRLVLQLLRRWQMGRRRFLDAVLLPGDIGIIPNPHRCDKATQKWIRRDPEEAGFSLDFMDPRADAAALLDEDPTLGPYSEIRAPICGVAGNHDDIAYLRSKSTVLPGHGAPNNTFPVDAMEMVHIIKDGSVAKITSQRGCSINIGGLWGIEYARKGAPYKISSKAADRLAYSSDVDVLLTHDAAEEGYPWDGSPSVTRIIKEAKPKIHIHGHVDPLGGCHRFDVEDSETQSWVLKHLIRPRHGEHDFEGMMGVFAWDGNTAKVSVSDDPKFFGSDSE